MPPTQHVGGVASVQKVLREEEVLETCLGRGVMLTKRPWANLIQMRIVQPWIMYSLILQL